MSHDFRKVNKILAIKLRHIGDVLLSVPVFRALRENFPDAHISALVNSGTEEVLTGNPLINEIIVLDRGIKKMNPAQKYLKELSFLKMIRAKGFDMAVDLTSGDRAAIISFVSGAKYRLAYDPGNDGFIGKRYLYTHLAKKDGSKHMVIQNLDIVKQFGINTDNLTVDIFIPEDARIFVKKIFEENNINPPSQPEKSPHPLDNPPSPPLSKVIPPNPPLVKGGWGDLKGGQGEGKVVHVHPTSRWQFKCWKDENMAEVIAWLIEHGINVIVTSSPDKKEMEKAKRILSLVSEFSYASGDSPDSEPAPLNTGASPVNLGQSPPFELTTPSHPPFGKGGHGGVIDLCGKTNIKQLAAISKASDLFLGVDSAPMHIAAAVGTPVIALFGPTGDAWRPWGNSGHIVIKKQLDCMPCKKGSCEGIHLRKCMEDIEPDAVKKILKMVIIDA